MVVYNSLLQTTFFVSPPIGIFNRKIYSFYQQIPNAIVFYVYFCSKLKKESWQIFGMN